MVALVLTFVGDDRPGLVSAISETIAAFGATWLESRSARLAGKFAGILLVSVPDAKAAELQSSLRLLELDGPPGDDRAGRIDRSGEAAGTPA